MSTGGFLAAVALGALGLLASEVVAGCLIFHFARRAYRRFVSGEPDMPFFGLSKLHAMIGGGLAMVLVAVGLVALGHVNGVKAAQKRIDPVVEDICGAAGSTWSQKGLGRRNYGKACLAEVRTLMAFKSEALASRQKLLEAHQREQAAKVAADAERAASDRAKAGKARRNMEAADAAVRDDRVGADWFARLNELGGLRDGEEARPGRAVRTPERRPAR